MTYSGNNGLKVGDTVLVTIPENAYLWEHWTDDLNNCHNCEFEISHIDEDGDCYLKANQIANCFPPNWLTTVSRVPTTPAPQHDHKEDLFW